VQKRADRLAGLPSAEQKGWSVRQGGAKDGEDTGSTHPGVGGHGGTDAAGEMGGGDIGRSDHGATTIVQGGRAGGTVGSGSGWKSAGDGGVQVAAPPSGAAGQFKEAQARLASQSTQGGGAGAAEEQIARMTPGAGANPAEGDAPIVDLPFNNSTPSDKTNVTPIEDGVSFNGQGATFALDSQMVIPDVTINNQAGAVSFCLQPQWGGSDQGDASLFQLRTPNQFNNRISIFKNGRFLRFLLADNTGIETDPGTVIDNWQPNQPHQITGTWSSNPDGGGNVQLYVDGSMVAQRSFDGQLDIPPGTPMYIGSDYSGGVPGAQGSISNFQVYGQSLPSDQIAGFNCSSGQ